MAELEIRQLKALRDNYVWLLRDPETAATGVVDPSDLALAPGRRAPLAKPVDVPATMGEELATNPFLRADQPALQAAMGTVGDPIAIFAEIRRRKDVF